MKVTWKKKSNKRKRPLESATSHNPILPFDRPEAAAGDDDDQEQQLKAAAAEPDCTSSHKTDAVDLKQLADSFQAQGNKLAEEGRLREALGKWESSLNLMPENAVLHEQKAQVWLELGDAWNALKAATRATELEPSWAEAWLTLGRAQLNFGEPDCANESFDKALGLKPDSDEAKDGKRTALQLIKRRKQLHSAGLSTTENRYAVRDKMEDVREVHESEKHDGLRS